MDLSHIATCHDMTEDDFVVASASRESAYELLNHASVICEPHSGEERLLLFLARCALQDWVDGDLRVEVRLEGMFECHLLLLCGLGGDAFEVMKRVFLSASFLSFKQLGEQPEELIPLELTSADNQRLVFDTTFEVRDSGIPDADLADGQGDLDQHVALAIPAGQGSGAGVDAPERDSPDFVPPRSSFVPELPLVQPGNRTCDPPSSQTVARIALRRAKRSARDITELLPTAEPGEDGRYRACRGSTDDDHMAAADADSLGACRRKEEGAAARGARGTKES